MKDETVQFVLRLVSQNHKKVIDACDSLLKTLAGENLDQKKAAAGGALRVAKDLQGVIANSDVPQWLSDLIHHLPIFIDGRWGTVDLLDFMIYKIPQIKNHQWSFSKTSETAFDFDAIFEHFKKESRLPELFEEIIRILEEIRASDEVDSVTMLKALGKVIATMKRSKDGSYFSLHGAWEFLLSFLKNYMWEELSKLPILGTAMEALRKTIEETNDEISKLHQQIKDEMARTVEADVKALKDKATFPFIAYDKGGHLLPGPAANAIGTA